MTTRPGSGDWLDSIESKAYLASAARSCRANAAGDRDHVAARQAINFAPELLDVVERVTGGVPLFIEEICQWMAENAASATDRLAQATTRSHASVLETVIDARLETLGPAREVARAAAVAGNRFNQELLRALLPELDDEIIANGAGCH